MPYAKVCLRRPPVRAQGAAVISDNIVTTLGNTPSDTQIRELGRWLGEREDPIFFTNSLSPLYPPAADFQRTASGVLAARLSRSGCGYILWFRPEMVDIVSTYGDEAEDLLTALHEVIGHGSGKLNPKLTHEAAYYLKEYASTLEEGRADLMALWNCWDPKMVEWGLMSNPDVAKAMSYNAVRAPLTQLSRNPTGHTIEEDQQRDRQMIVEFIRGKTGSIETVNRNGKTYYTIASFAKMREGMGMLLAELMRIKAEGDYDAIKKLIDRYGVHFDPKLRDQVAKRYTALDLPVYWAGVNAEFAPAFGAGENSHM
jgi:Phytochrome region/Peptidase family M49